MEDNIKTDLKEIPYLNMRWVYLVLANRVMNFQVPKNSGNYLSRLVTTKFSRTCSKKLDFGQWSYTIQGSFPGGRKGFISSITHPKWLSGTNSLLFNGHSQFLPGRKWLQHQSDHTHIYLVPKTAIGGSVYNPPA